MNGIVNVGFSLLFSFLVGLIGMKCDIILEHKIVWFHWRGYGGKK